MNNFLKETENLKRSEDSSQFLKDLASIDINNNISKIDVPRYYITPDELKDIFDRIFGNNFEETKNIKESKDSSQFLKDLASIGINNDTSNIDVPRYYITPDELKYIFNRVFGVDT